MNKRFLSLALISVVCTVFAVAGAEAQKAKKVTVGRTVAEKGLVGVNLYDSANKVLQLYGSPNQLQSVGVGGAAVGPVGGPTGGGPGGAGRPGGGARGGGGGGGIAPTGIDQVFGSQGYGFADELLRQDLSGQSGLGGGGGGGGGGQRAGAAGGGGGATEQKILFTRWIYNRTSSKYSFIVDKNFRVVQIEAIGINDPKVRTAKGLSFGANFARIINSYGTPDAYGISGDNIVIHFLQRHKVAFRMSRLGASKEHVITGIVIAGGKA